MRTRYLLSVCLVVTLFACAPYGGYYETTMGAMATLGTTVPMDIATPTITILIPIIDVATITIPMATGTGVIREMWDMMDGKEGAGGLKAAVAGERRRRWGRRWRRWARRTSLTLPWLPVDHRQRPVHSGSYGQ